MSQKTKKKHIYDYDSSFPVLLDDRLWSCSAHGLLLPERIQPPGPAGRQRVPHVLLPPVSQHAPVAAGPPLNTDEINS